MTKLIKSTEELIEFIQAGDYSKVIAVADHNTCDSCVPLLSDILTVDQVLNFSPGEENKILSICEFVWGQLTELQVDRHGLIINIGGGVVTDLGGFCAATYKRGIDFIQVPTSLLAMVDAAIGGKTGVDLNGYKNQVGSFAQPKAVFIYPKFLETLPPEEWVSGYAEIYKHALIADSILYQQLNQKTAINPGEDWSPIIDRAIQIKEDIVSRDPFEKKDRKALNYGHTLGHAIESFQLNMDRPIAHGLAVAMGMVCESFLSHRRGYLTQEELDPITEHLRVIFDLFQIDSVVYNDVYTYALGDKKNKDGKILCTMIGPVGSFHINQEIQKTDIADSLDYLNSRIL